MTRKQKRSLIKILAAAVLFAAGILCRPWPVVSAALFLGAWLLSGLDILVRALKGIVHGELLDENFLMSAASMGALILGDFSEGVAVMLFYRVGELFESVAVDRSRRSITSMMELKADEAHVLRDGEILTVDPEEAAVGEILVIRPGEKIPLDGVVIEGVSEINTAALTGESLPRRISPGDELLSGCVNGEGLLKMRVTKAAHESTVARILELVENSAARKSKSEAFITKFARVYTPTVVGLALAIAVIPPILSGFTGWGGWIHRGLTFLVISCPCALVISVPLSFFGGIGAASRLGILVKGGSYLEALAAADCVVLDKTGTLTRGSFSVRELRPNMIGEDELLVLAAKCEAASTHPIARSILDAYRERFGGEPDLSDVRSVTEVAGNGVSCMLAKETVAAGNRRLMKTLGVPCDTPDCPGTVVHVAATFGQSEEGRPTGKRYLGCILIADEIKPTAPSAIARLKAAGIRKTVMLTGDTERTAAAVAAEVGVDEYRAELLPDGKVAAVEALIAEGKGKVAFVGDGINDAPVLSLADIGIAMGGIGSDAAIEAADAVLMDDDPAKIADAIAIARRSVRISRQNIVFALSVKALILLLGAFGYAGMWLAVFADVGVSVIAILNAMRCLRTKTE